MVLTDNYWQSVITAILPRDFMAWQQESAFTRLVDKGEYIGGLSLETPCMAGIGRENESRGATGFVMFTDWRRGELGGLLVGLSLE